MNVALLVAALALMLVIPDASYYRGSCCLDDPLRKAIHRVRERRR